MRVSRAAALVGLILGVFGCAGIGTEPEHPCCTVGDVMSLHADGVEDDVIIAAIRASGTDLELSAPEIHKLSLAGVSPAVIDALNGGPCVCGAEALQPGRDPVPVDGDGLHVAVKYNGGKNFELVNQSSQEYTELHLVVNGDYEHQIKRLPPKAGDFVRLSAFVSRTTGEEGRGITMETLEITADQGTFSREF